MMYRNAQGQKGEIMINVINGAKLGPGEVTAINHAVELARFEKEKKKSTWSNLQRSFIIGAAHTFQSLHSNGLRR